METCLDIHNYQCWYLENLQYQGKLLTLTLGESSRVSEEHTDPKKFLVVFSDTIQYQVYDECDHSKDFHANRESGVVGEYQNSSLIEYLKSETLIYDTTPGELRHFSIMTGNEFIHVITRKEPLILNVT